MIIPTKLNNFECYAEGRAHLGITDVTMPNLTYKTETVSGAGIKGEVNIPAIAHVDAMTTSINWTSLGAVPVRLFAPEAHLLEFEGRQQSVDPATQTFGTQDFRVIMKVAPTGLTMGTLAPATKTGTSSEFSVLYLKVDINGVNVLEIDPFNSIFRVNGKEY